jgi:hypothetical protein
MDSSRIDDRRLRSKVMSAGGAANLIAPGSAVGISGSTGGPKVEVDAGGALPSDLTAEIEIERTTGSRP